MSNENVEPETYGLLDRRSTDWTTCMVKPSQCSAQITLNFQCSYSEKLRKPDINSKDIINFWGFMRVIMVKWCRFVYNKHKHMYVVCVFFQFVFIFTKKILEAQSSVGNVNSLTASSTLGVIPYGFTRWVTPDRLRICSNLVHIKFEMCQA